MFGHDLFLIKQANLVIVNAEVPIGIGTAQEMILARYFRKPVVSISPRGTFYSPFKEKVNGKEVNNWRHPFLNTLSDWIVEDVKEIKPILMEKLKNKKIPKWKSFIKRAIEYYLKEYFPRDIKTQKMLKI